MNNSYLRKLLQQKLNSNLPTQRIYYGNLYSKIENELTTNNKILEIGSGAGLSENFITNFDVIRTDYLDWSPQTSIKGNIDAENLPYMDNSFDIVFGVDMIHHVNNPINVLKEAIRVSKNKGKIIFVEPYVSLTSYIIYKLFHEENTTYNFEISHMNGNKYPQEGDQGVAKSLFTSKKGLTYLENIMISSDQVLIKLLHPFSFFATGGLSKPLKTKPTFIKKLLNLEEKIPNWLMKVIASRMMIIIEVTK